MVNQCNFIGRCGKDVEIRYSQSGAAVANVSIACSESWKDANGEQVENTEWVRVVAFKRLAEIMGEFLRKGSLIYISGKMQTRQWEDQDNNKRYTTEIVAREMKMLSPKCNSQDDNGGGEDYGSTGEDIPF